VSGGSGSISAWPRSLIAAIASRLYSSAPSYSDSAFVTHDPQRIFWPVVFGHRWPRQGGYRVLEYQKHLASPPRFRGPSEWEKASSIW
jgi:hypothetical protein